MGESLPTLNRWNTSPMGILRYLVREQWPALILVTLLIVATASSPAFLTETNLRNLVSQLSVTGLVVLAQLVVVITGGIDISVGSILALAAVLSAGMFDGSNVWLAIVIAMVTGMVLGACNGALIAFRGVEPFIVTLGMMALARGLVYAYTEGSPKIPTDPLFTVAGTARVFGFPVIGFFWIAAVVVIWIVLHRTVFGRRVFAIGSSRKAAHSAGIPVNRTAFLVYVISGLLCGLGGFLLSSRVAAGTPSAGLAYELDAIAAVVIGGTSLVGGKGRVIGAVIGTLVFGIIANLLVLLNVSTFFQDAFKGALILVAVAFAAGRKGGLAGAR